MDNPAEKAIPRPGKRADSTAIGSVAPDFSLVHPITGQEIRLRDFSGQDVLLVFFRGTWCPFCRQQMALLAQNHDRLKSCRIALLGVVCQSPVSVRRFLEANALPFPLLPDSDRSVARAYGVHYWLSAEGLNLAKPSLFILDKNATITFRYVGKNMTDLPVGVIIDKFLTFLSQ